MKNNCNVDCIRTKKEMIKDAEKMLNYFNENLIKNNAPYYLIQGENFWEYIEIDKITGQIYERK